MKRSDVEAENARLKAALNRVLAAACDGCARGIDNHWWVCREVRKETSLAAAPRPETRESGVEY